MTNEVGDRMPKKRLLRMTEYWPFCEMFGPGISTHQRSLVIPRIAKSEETAMTNGVGVG